ncbi:MAG: prepilin-type N-terminal cleavage/methylation domain-containing protein [Planctomycetota bacterium]
MPMKTLVQVYHATKPRGFSLIELLVVISIIALLIGILLPTLPGVINTARQTACSAQLRGIGQGIELYKNDNTDVFPIAKYMPDPWLSGSDSPSLNVALTQYIEPDSDGYECPGDKIVFPFEYTAENGQVVNCGSSYTYITGLGGRRIEESWFVERLQFNPSQVPVLNDYDGGTFETQDGQFVQVDFFHGQRMFYFADGSAGQIRD